MQSQHNLSSEQLAASINFEFTYYQKTNPLDAITVKSILHTCIPSEYDENSVIEVLKKVREKCNLPKAIRNPNFFVGYVINNSEEISTTLNAVDGGIICFLNPFSDKAIQILQDDIFAKLLDTKNIKISDADNKLLSIANERFDEAHKSSDGDKNKNMVALLEVQLAILNGKRLTSGQLSLLELPSNICTII